MGGFPDHCNAPRGRGRDGTFSLAGPTEEEEQRITRVGTDNTIIGIRGAEAIPHSGAILLVEIRVIPDPFCSQRSFRSREPLRPNPSTSRPHVGCSRAPPRILSSSESGLEIVGSLTPSPPCENRGNENDACARRSDGTEADWFEPASVDPTDGRCRTIKEGSRDGHT
jgi:hypothetical protein